MTDAPIRVLFVCHANQCRSPLAEGIFVEMLRERGLEGRFEVDSAGTWAADGIEPHPGSVAVAREHGIALLEICRRSRSIEPGDLQNFDHVIAMDRDNESDILRLRRISAFGETEGKQAKIRLLRAVIDPDVRGSGADVPDPVRSGPRLFGKVYAIIEGGCRALLDELAQ